ncbi:hypothetical protein BGZ76_009671 [Entomortierella beljakovae]|nr:hypothetical protein BGZ76_009671 [Entomortierella beljakovae]
MSQERGRTTPKVDESLMGRLCQLSLEQKRDSSVDDLDDQNNLCSIASSDDDDENDEDDEDDDENGDNHRVTFDSDDDDFEQIVYVPPEEFSDWSNIGSIATSPPLTPTSTTLPLSQSSSPSPTSPTVVPSSIVPTWKPIALHEPSAPIANAIPTAPSILLPPMPEASETLLAQQKHIIVHVTQKEESKEDQEEEVEEEEKEKIIFILGIPKETWKWICSYLYPSELTRLSTVNKTMYELVKDLKVWKEWYFKSQKSSKLALIPGLSESHSFMLYLCSVSFSICELCIRSCKGNRQRGRLAAMPLPVVFSSSPSSSSITSNNGGKTNSNNNEDGDITLQDTWTIRLCRVCRVSHYTEHPEPIDSTPKNSFLLKRTIKAEYRLGDKEIRSIEKRIGGGRRGNKPVKYNERVAISIARRVYGGDVGIQALGKSLSKPLSKVYHRVFLYHRRRSVLANGKTWWSAEEFKARKAGGLLTE